MALTIPSWMSWYKKPSYVDLKSFAASLSRRAEEKSEERSSSRNSFSSLKGEESVPKTLTLERVLTNETCSPMSLYDFYMYLKHIEFSQENLEFYLWYKDYQQRYEQEQMRAVKLSKEPDVEVLSITSTNASALDQVDAHVEQPSKPFVRRQFSISPGFVTYIESLVLHEAARYPKPCCAAFLESARSCNDSHSRQTPMTIDDEHHEELQNMISLFLLPGSSRELNIPPSMRKAALTGLATSTSSEHLRKIAEHIYALLKYGSHRNFVRLGVNNGTFETLCMVTFVGITMTVCGLLTMFTLAFASPTIHSSSCWRGLATIPFWFIGLSFLLAGMRGSCFLLLLFSRRQELPWERVVDAADQQSVQTNSSSSRTPNNFISRFAKRLMIFERKIRVKDMGLRRLQRKIVIQSVLGAAIGTALLEVFFLCLPIWKKT